MLWLRNKKNIFSYALLSGGLWTHIHIAADEFKPHEDDGSGHDEDDDVSSGVDENEVTSDSASEPDTPVKVLLESANVL